MVPALMILLLAASMAAPAADRPSKSGKYLVYFGTYTRPGKSQGIYVARFDARTGELSAPELAAETASPSFLAIDPADKFLYAVGEVGNFQGQRGGSVTAFAIDRNTGKLRQLNSVTSGGPGPCFVSVDRTGKNVLLANYSGGSVEVAPIQPDGRLGNPSCFLQHAGKGPNPKRQEGPHAHSINLSPDNRFAIVADLGLDKVLVYRFDPQTGKLTPNEPPAASVASGAGPRHFAFAPDGTTAYVINELAQTVTAFRWDPKAGTLTEFQTLSTLPDGLQVEGNSTAEVLVHPSGRFVYGSNRGHDSIAVFERAKDGKLKLVQNASVEGKVPRNFRIDPSGAWLLAANQNSDNVTVFRIDPKSGKLTYTNRSIPVFSPVCVKFVPAAD